MIRIRHRERGRLLVVSPWLLAAAIGLLTLIIVVFAVNNLQRERRIMMESLLLKGEALVRFVGAGTRASMMMGGNGSGQIQRLIEQASVEPDIRFIALIDNAGMILAHSEPSLIGTSLGRDLQRLQAVAAGRSFHVVTDGPVRTFEVVRPFRPFRRGFGQGMQRWRMMSRRGNGPLPPSVISRSCPSGMGGDAGSAPVAPGRSDASAGRSQDWCQRFFDSGSSGDAGSLVLVGLDMTEQEEVIAQGRFHVILMSAVLLLVGVGGWFVLMAAQGYRVSRETLRHLQAFAGLLISRLPVGIVATDPDGRIKTFNRTMAQLVATPADAAVGHRPATVLPAPFVAFFEQPGRDEEWLDREIVFESDTGRRHELRLSSAPLADEQGQGMGRVLLVQDVTERRRLEAELRRHDRLVALGKMAAGVAHEVRNPLSSIKGFATLLGAKFDRRSEEAEAAALLVKEVDRLNRSITELLNYARPLPLKLEPVEVGRLIDDSLKLMRADAEALGVAVTVEVAAGLPPLSADADRLNQVLLNLYLNALQAMEGGGALRVTARASRQPGRIEIEVKDSGCGIAPDDLDRVLDPYFTTKASGTGLGLALAAKIVDEHGGTLGLASELGRGTTVTLTLPAAEGADAAAAGNGCAGGRGVV